MSEGVEKAKFRSNNHIVSLQVQPVPSKAKRVTYSIQILLKVKLFHTNFDNDSGKLHDQFKLRTSGKNKKKKKTKKVPHLEISIHIR